MGAAAAAGGAAEAAVVVGVRKEIAPAATAMAGRREAVALMA